MVHKKKQDMVLNLGLGGKGNTFSDQTPTPTQFIRNCEEVGLFQDLQNVNPFEETFKRAAEAVKAGQTPTLDRPFQSNTCDDTLHTPNVFPHITDLPGGNPNVEQGRQENKHLDGNSPVKDKVKNPDEKELKSKNFLDSKKLILGNVSYKRMKQCFGDDSGVKEVQNDRNLVVNEKKVVETCLKHVPPNDDTNNLNEMPMVIKEKIKNNIASKQMPLLIQLKVPIPKSKSASRCEKSQKDKFSTFSKNSLKFECNTDKSESNSSNKYKNTNVKKNYTGLPKEKIEILERNRAAAIRCRQKKKIYVSYLEKLNHELTDANRKLAYDNACLKKQVSDLKAELLKHHNCSVSNSTKGTLNASVGRADTNDKSVEEFQIERKISENIQNNIASRKNSKTNIKIEGVEAVSKDAELSLTNKFSSTSESQNSSDRFYNENFSTFYSKPCSMKSVQEEDKLRKIYIDHSYFNYPYVTNFRKKSPTTAARSKFTQDFLTMNIRNQNYIKENNETVDVLLSQTESVLEVQTEDLPL